MDSLTMLVALGGVSQTEAVKSVPDIIAQASKSTLGILALIVLGLAVLAWTFFKKAKENVRIGIFVLLFAGTVLYTWAIIGSTSTAGIKASTNSATPIVIAGVILDDASGNAIPRAEVSIVGRPERTLSDDTGRFQITCEGLTPDRLKQVELRAAKEQYEPKDWSVAQVSQSLSIPLVRHH
jgi:hypothetical protein